MKLGSDIEFLVLELNKILWTFQIVHRQRGGPFPRELVLVKELVGEADAEGDDLPRILQGIIFELDILLREGLIKHLNDGIIRVFLGLANDVENILEQASRFEGLIEENPHLIARAERATFHIEEKLSFITDTFNKVDQLGDWGLQKAILVRTLLEVMGMLGGILYFFQPHSTMEATVDLLFNPSVIDHGEGAVRDGWALISDLQRDIVLDFAMLQYEEITRLCLATAV